MDGKPAMTCFKYQVYLHPFESELYFYGKITIPMLKIKEKFCMVEEPSHEKQLSLILVCKIGLTSFFLFSHRSLFLSPRLGILCDVS